MNALSVIKHACADALDADSLHPAEYASVVDPGSVYEMATIIEEFVQYATRMGDQALVADLRRRIE